MKVYQTKGVFLHGINIIPTGTPPFPPVAVFSVDQIGNPVTASDVGNGDNFGRAIDMTNTFAIIGSPNHSLTYDQTYSLAGSAYIFEYDGSEWSEILKIDAGDPTDNGDVMAGAKFGTAVAINENHIVVGAESYNDTGAAYVFETQDQWSTTSIQKLTITPPNPLGLNVGDFVGCSVSIDGDRLLIGARGIDNGISNQGAVFAFNKIGGTWSQTQTIISSVPFSGGEFGVSVDMSGNYAVVGAWREDNSNGVAYVYEYSNNQWNLMNRLLAPEFISGQRFGTSVAIDGNTIAIGAAYSGIGRAYVYRRNGQSWEYQDTLAANNVDGTIVDPSASSNDGQGISVGVDESNNVILVSAHRNNSTGTVYVYENVNNTWSPSAIQPISKINGNPSSSNDFFGLPVSIFNGNVIVGASRRDSSPLSDNGFVYFFKSN